MIFADLKPEFSSTVAAACLLEAKTRAFDRPCSLVQIGMDEADYDWLRLWASSVGKDDAYRWSAWERRSIQGSGGSLWSGQEAFGAVLLALFTEEARRKAQEGEIWPFLPPLFKPPAVRELFVHGQPHSDLRHTLEAAARRLRVRHVFGIEGTQAWYVTLYLQFGFTGKAIANGALRDWLQGANLPISVHVLREHDSEFQKLWDDCRKFLQGNLPESSFRSYVRRSPFILPEWEDALVRGLSVEDGPSVRALLVWLPPAPPQFQIRLQNLVAQGLSESGYDVYLQGVWAARVLRERDGSFTLDQDLIVPLGPPQLSLQLIGDDSGESRDLSVDAWDSDDGFGVFDLTNGQQVSARRTLSRARSYAILAPSELEFRPGWSQPYRVPSMPMHLHLLPAGREDTACLLMEGAAFWSEAAAPPLALRAEYPSRRTLDVGETAELTILGLPTDVSRLRVWWRGQPLVARPSAIGWDIEFVVPADLASSDVSLAGVATTPRGPVRFTISVHVPVCSVALRRGEDWTRPPVDCLRVREAQTLPWRVVLPESGERRALLEGNVFSSRVGSGARVLGTFAGYGAALRLRKGPYNCEGPDLLLAREVVRRGVLLDVRHEGSDAVLQLAHPIDADDEGWEVLILDASGSAVRKRPGRACCGDEWQLEVGPQPVALGLSYGARLLGSWCESGWKLPGQTGEARRLAGLLRWLHLPLLRPGLRKAVRVLAEANPTEFLVAWLHDRNVDGLEHGAVTEEWLEVVRSALRNWGPTPDFGADRLVGRLNRYKVPDAYKLLVEVHPTLVARVAKAHLEWNNVTGAAASRALLQQAAELLGLPGGSSEAQVRARRDVLIEDARAAMQVDPNFVRMLLKRFGHQDENLELALAVRPFRHLAAADLLLRLGGKSWN